MLIEHNNKSSVRWALDVFTKAHCSASADVPKNQTANVFNNHFLSIAESLIEPWTPVYYMSIQIFCMISANKKTSQQDPFVIPHISFLELGKSILKLEKNKKTKNKSCLVARLV